MAACDGEVTAGGPAWRSGLSFSWERAREASLACGFHQRVCGVLSGLCSPSSPSRVLLPLLS